MMRSRLRVTISPADVGKRVTVRVRTHAPPSEPAFTDVVGELLAWEEGTLRIRRRDGSVTAVEAADLAAARVIPPPPMRYAR